MNIVPGRFNALRPGCRTQPFTEIRPSRACFQSDNLLDVTCRIDTESRLRASLHRCHRSTNRGPTCRAVQSATSPPLGSAESLVAWLEQCGVPWDKNAARPSFNEGGPALVANRTAAGGSSLLTVPESAWVTTDVVAKSMIGKEVKGLEPWLQIALFLVAERAAPTSQFKPYISSLPNKPNLLTFWSDSELRELEGTQLLESLEGYKAFFKARFEQLEGSLFEEHRDLFPPEIFSFAAFLWAVSVVRARVHPPLEGDRVALVPGADLVRHRRAGPAKWEVGPTGLFGQTQALTVAALREVAEGEVVAMDFGPSKTDVEILLDYGVWDPEAAQGAFLLTLSLPEAASNFDDKADILDQTETFGATWEAGHKFRLLAGRPVDPDLLAFLRLVNLSGPDSFLLEALFRNEAWEHMTLPVSEDNERAVCLSMIDGCRQALKGYRTSVEEDLRLLPGLDPGSPLDLAVRARLGEKEALTTTLNYFEDRLQRLSDLEYYQERRLRRLGLLDDSGKSTYDGFFKDGIA